MELATTRAQLSRDQQLAHQLATSRAEFARADAIARMLTKEEEKKRNFKPRN